ncbi:valine--tRNA ligase [Candidatus Micrarchaeota archaeon]|nr:valine--tRNA ligase [Candidatus Micrarchaeota archaeon]
MPLSKLDFKAIEAKWTKNWQESGTYRFDDSDTTSPVYSIDSPPPFTSGALHMGHMLSYSYFDFAARFKRMKGHNVFFPQGWDCQGFPTEIRVEKKFGRLPRGQFLEKCREFTLANISAMRAQMDRMGFSPDWRFEYRTMDDDYHRRVQHSLIAMYEKGLVYRAKHPVLFCTGCQSAIAKAETEDTEHEGLFNTIQFTVEETGEPLPIATTRPEMIHACHAVLIHPQDPRAESLSGKHAVTPLFGKAVPIIADADVEKGLGTGCVMVCSFGDKEDVTWIYRHKLPVSDAWNHAGKVLNAGPGFDGLAINAMRERVLEELKTQGKLLAQEKVRRTIKTHDRCGKPVDFLATMQWFVRIKGLEEKIVNAARKMRWIPEFSIQYLEDWANFIEYDWVISRQRVYGTPIPFYYCEKCGKGYAPGYSRLPIDPSKTPFGKGGKCTDCGGNIVGESSTCDVWVDSSITPLVITGWPDEKHSELLRRAYPATLRPQGLEIIRTWAFYTIVRCLALTGEAPFREVLINGSVLGTDGKKMSKSAGNYEDPELLLNKYAADALRQWAALSGAFARDRPFSYKDVEYGQSFLVKLYNASRFVEKVLGDGKGPASGHLELSEEAAAGMRATDKWLMGRLNETVKKCNDALKGYDYYAAITAIHSFVWHDFCDFYLEEVKYRAYSQDETASSKAAKHCLAKALQTSLRLLAPFAPFLTEEIHQEMFAGVRHAGGSSPKAHSIHKTEYPSPEEEYINPPEQNIVEVLHFLLAEVRKFKASKGLALNQELSFAKITLKEGELRDFPLIEEELREVGRILQVSPEAGGNENSIEPRV